MSDPRLDHSALRECLDTLNHLFVDIVRLRYEQGYEEIVGGYCELKVATLDSGKSTSKLVAAKKLRFGARALEPNRLAFRLARELKVWAGLRHPHVLPLLGFHLGDDYKTALLISEYMKHGDLKDFIAKTKPSRNERLYLVRDLTDGLAYLHTQNAPIRHGDLKPGNVLVNSDRRALLADFGLSKTLDTGPTGFTTGNDARYTIRYSSPEVLLEGRAAESLPNDIWSWGCLVVEVLTDEIPFSNIKLDAQLMLAIVQGKFPSDVANFSSCTQEFKVLLANCWSRQPSQRPTAVDCLRTVESALPRRPTPSAPLSIQSTSLAANSSSLTMGTPGAGAGLPESTPIVPRLKQFPCPLYSCGKSFKRMEHMKRHLRAHTMERPFACDKCGKKFGRSDYLTRHLRTHSKDSGELSVKDGVGFEGSGGENDGSASDESDAMGLGEIDLEQDDVVGVVGPRVPMTVFDGARQGHNSPTPFTNNPPLSSSSFGGNALFSSAPSANAGYENLSLLPGYAQGSSFHGSVGPIRGHGSATGTIPPGSVPHGYHPYLHRQLQSRPRDFSTSSSRGMGAEDGVSQGVPGVAGGYRGVLGLTSWVDPSVNAQVVGSADFHSPSVVDDVGVDNALLYGGDGPSLVAAAPEGSVPLAGRYLMGSEGHPRRQGPLGLSPHAT